MGVPPSGILEDSPFHLPARLADGLGPGSDLGHGYPRPCAPSSIKSRNLGPPRRPSGRKAGLGCYTNCQDQSHGGDGLSRVPFICIGGTCLAARVGFACRSLGPEVACRGRSFSRRRTFWPSAARRSYRVLPQGQAGLERAWALAAIHRVRVISWIFWVVLSLRRHPGKVRALVLPRCCCSSKSPSSRLRKVARTKAPVR